jgi:pimeloyl-ACP methyl ester carboxylesterase
MPKKMLHYEVRQLNQNAEWIVFIHGAGGSTATWKYQLAAFKDYFNLLLMDLRDHGETGKLDETEQYNFGLITKDIVEVIDYVGIEKAHFVTLSFGSVILQDLSLRYPHLVLSAIFAGGIFKPNWAIKSFVYLAKILNIILPYKWMYSVFSYLLMPRKHHQLSRKIYQRQAAKIQPKAYMRWVGLYKEFFELLNRYFYQEINFPALVLMGSEDYVFLASANNFVELHSRAKLRVIKHAGHICNIDQYQKFNELALSFISNSQTSDLPT